MQRICVKCNRQRNTSYLLEAVFRHPYWEVYDEGVDIWKCSSSASCRKARKVSK